MNLPSNDANLLLFIVRITKPRSPHTHTNTCTHYSYSNERRSRSFFVCLSFSHDKRENHCCRSKIKKRETETAIMTSFVCTVRLSKIREKWLMDRLTPFRGDLFEHEFLLNIASFKSCVKKKSARILDECIRR